jgi:hypothetical protein
MYFNWMPCKWLTTAKPPPFSYKPETQSLSKKAFSKTTNLLLETAGWAVFIPAHDSLRYSHE